MPLNNVVGAEPSAPSYAACLVPGSPRRLTYSGLGSAAAIQTGGASATPKAVHLIQSDSKTKIKKHDSMILWKRGVIQCCAGGNGIAIHGPTDTGNAIGLEKHRPLQRLYTEVLSFP